MNSMMQKAIEAFIRHLLTALAGYFVTQGIWTEDQAMNFSIAAASAIAALLWSLYEKYRDRETFKLALASPKGTSEAEVAQKFKAGVRAPEPKDA